MPMRGRVAVGDRDRCRRTSSNLARWHRSPDWWGLAAQWALPMNLAARRLLDTGFTYETVFNIVGSLHLIAFVVILIAIPQIRPIE